MILRHAFALLVLCVLAAPLAAQGGTTYYVDPVNGDDANAGGFGDPFKSVTKALTVVLSGDRIELRSGTYQEPDETFPLVPASGVDICAAPGQGPVFDGNSTVATCFRLSQNIAATTTLEGVTITGFDTGVFVPPGTSTALYTVESCSFNAFTNAAVEAEYDQAGDHSLVVRDCDISTSSAAYGIRFVANGAAVNLQTSLLEDNNFLNCDIAIAVEARAGGRVFNNCQVRRNSITTEVTGIWLYAESSMSAQSINNVKVNGNNVTGNGSAGQFGLHLECRFGVGQTTQIGAAIEHNQFIANETNVVIQTVADSASEAVITSPFTGNLITSAAADGILFDVTLPKPLGTNAAPDFGTQALNTGRNTIQSNVGFDVVLDGDMQNVIQAENNFWNQTTLGGIVSRIQDNGALLPDVSPFLLTALNGRLNPREIAEQAVVDITVRAGANSLFVDNPDDDASVGQMIVVVRKGSTSTQVTPFVFNDGSGFLFQSPALAPDTYSVDIVLPGGQALSLVLIVGSGGAGGSTGGGGCFVATAAHGDYDAPEVVVLRRFRDEYLLTTEAGRDFTAAYYRHGPVLAEAIADRPWARSLARATLAPPVTVARALLAWNRGQRFAAAVGLLGLAFLLRRRRR